MTFLNESAATAARVLNKCFTEVKPAGPWRWHCVAQNGACLPITAAIEEGFLHLAGRPEPLPKGSGAPLRALKENATLAGGVKFALSPAGQGLYLRTDIVLLEEAQLLERVRWALAGFQHSPRRLKSHDDGGGVSAAPESAPADLGERLQETAWLCTERGPNDFAAELGADSAPPARIRMNEHGLAFSVELVRSAAGAELPGEALAVFLLTAGAALRLARAHALEMDGQRSFGFQVSLPAGAAVEEIDHALAALSIAYRMCAREANVLLEEAAARCYLTARGFPTIHDLEHEKEN
jgi:hypothetical protein